ncbi:MAG: GNAT family N-acetyltransferase [Ignavibacteriales bacterium]|nr:GNAT family N-acetyltransferase [Ignavibacteriales bacterium]
MHTENIIVSKAKLAELNELLIVAAKTFYDTFSEVNTEEDMKMYLAEHFTFEKLSSEFNNPYSEFYIATLNDRIIGYLKINFGQAQTETIQNNTIEIERIYVLKEFQGHKVGNLLLDKAFEAAKQKKINFVWLGVWEKNVKAISFYKKNGFTESGKHLFKLGTEEQTDIIMKKKLETSNATAA